MSDNEAGEQLATSGAALAAGDDPSLVRDPEPRQALVDAIYWTIDGIVTGRLIEHLVKDREPDLFTADLVRWYLPEWAEEYNVYPNAVGAAFRRASKHRLIIDTGRIVKSRRVVAHAGKARVWRINRDTEDIARARAQDQDN